jgi:hypothetical protein
MIGDSAGRAETTSDPPVSPAPSAVVRFQYVPSGSGVSRSGAIRPGSPLAIAYDPARFSNADPHGVAPSSGDEILGHVRFHPGGQTTSAPVAQRAAGDPLTPAAVPRPVPFEVVVPDDATQVEVWFERRGGAGTDAWDSRYGQNFWFDVDTAGLAIPPRSVGYRTGAVADPRMLGVDADTATKEHTPVGASGSRVVVRLAVEAWIRDAAAARAAWVDVHVFDGAEDLVHAATVPLDRRPGGDEETARFVWDDAVYQGSGGGSGVGVTFRPDAHLVQYRVYGEVHGQVFTDGVLHQLALPPDRELGSHPAAHRRDRALPVERQ